MRCFMDDGGSNLFCRCLRVHDKRVIHLALAPRMDVLGQTTRQRHDKDTLQVALNLCVLPRIHVGNEPKSIGCSRKQLALVKPPAAGSHPDSVNSVSSRQGIGESNTDGTNPAPYCPAKGSQHL